MAEGMVRIPGARPIKRRINKENDWNDRFWVNEPPKYDPMADVHCGTYLEQIGRKKKVVLAPGRIRRARSPIPKQKVNRQVSRSAVRAEPVISTQILKNMTDEFMFICGEKKIPDNIQLQFLKAIDNLSAKNKATTLAKEIEAINKGRSHAPYIPEAIAERENLLSQIKVLANEKVVDRQQATNLLLDYRTATLNVIEHLAFWKDKMQKLNPKHQYIWHHEGKNYIVTLRSDTNYLYTSTLANLFEFARNADPLLINPAQVHVRNPHLYRNKENLAIPVNIFNRIKAAKEIVEDECKAHKRRAKRLYKGRATAQSSDHFVTVQEDRPLSAEGVATSRTIMGIDEAPEDQERSPEKQVKEEPQDIVEEAEPIEGITFHAFSCAWDEAIRRVEGYLKSADRDLTQTMPEIDDIKDTGRNGAWFWIKNPLLETIGLVIFYIDTSSIMLRRISISHISCTKFKDFENCLTAAVQMLFTQYPAQEIRISLLHTEDPDGKLVIIPHVKQAVEKVDFKWKNLTNPAGKRRVLIMGVRNTDDEGANQATKGYFEEVLHIKVGSIVQLMDTPDDATSSPQNINGIFNLANALRQVAQNDYAPEHSSISAFYPQIPKDFRFPATRLKQDESFDAATEDIVNDGVNIVPPRTPDGRYSTAYSSIGLKWPEYSFVSKSGINYIRISTDIMVTNSGEHTIYLIPTDDGNFTSFVISPPTEDHAVLKNMDMENVSEIDHIALPALSFDGTRNITMLRGEGVADSFINDVQEYISVKISDLKPLNGALKQETDTFISKPFTFGLIYAKLDEEPYLMTTMKS